MDGPSVADAKRELRDELQAERRAMSSAEIDAARAAIRAAVLARMNSSDGRWTCVAGYRPLRTEPGSVQLLDALHASGVRVLVPLTLEDRDLDWLEWGAPSDPLGMPAIATADLILVPALAVSVDGVRLGRGGGSYDRALGRVAPGTQVVALLFDGEVRDWLPADEWDVPVTAVVTPSGWRAVGSSGPR
ncbi:MAG: 5-formyltetrahydrofolate cyclo-ligase [Actinomycetota bacterium]